jgi:cytochrome c-type biogenesis protein CcmH/NrfG
VKAKWVAVGLTAVLAFYLVTLGQRGWALLTSGETSGAVMGVGVLLLPVLVGWAVWRELRFGIATERMARQLDGEGGLPAEALTRTPGGRVERSSADAVFTQYREAAQDAPADWRSWFRLAWAYDVAGDRRRARAAMRHAVRLYD